MVFVLKVRGKVKRELTLAFYLKRFVCWAEDWARPKKGGIGLFVGYLFLDYKSNKNRSGLVFGLTRTIFANLVKCKDWIWHVSKVFHGVEYAK